jgi:outer membrane protein assembly factor BamB
MTVKTVHEVAAGADAFYALHRGGTDLGSEDRQQLTRIETDGSLAWQVDIEDAAAESGISPKSTFMSPSGGFGELTVTESAVQVRVWEGGKRYAYLSFDLTTGEFTEVDDLDEVSAPLFGGVASYGYGPELDVFGNVAEPITAQGFTIAEVGDAIEGVGPNGERWELDADGEPFTCGDTLYVATPEAQLYVLDPTTGEQLYGPVDYSGHGLETSYGPILGVVPEGVFGWRRALDDDGEDELLLISAE